MRKITSIVLSLIMVFTMFSAVPAFADTEDAVTIPSSGLRLEHEDVMGTYYFRDTYAPNASKGTVLQTNWGGSTNPSGRIKLTVEKSGYYNLTNILNKYKSGSYSQITTTIYGADGETIIIQYDNNTTFAGGTVTDVTNSEAYTGVSKRGAFSNILKLEHKKIYLEAGTIYLDIMVLAYTSGKYAFFADYFEFTPSFNAVNLSESETTTVEFEDYVNPEYESLIRTNTVDPEIKFVGQYYGNKAYPIVDIILDVAKAGFYDVDLIMSRHVNSQSYGVVTVEIVNESGNVLSTFDNYEGRNYSGTLEGYCWNDAYNPPVATYSTKVNLPKGRVTIKVKLKSNQGSYGTCSSNCILDNIKLTPNLLVDINDEAGTVTLTGKYANAVSGTPIIALYNGDKLVVAQECDAVSNATVVTATIDAQGKAYTEAKLFVWNNMNDIVPQVASKTYIK